MWQWPNGKACTTVPRSDKRLNWCFRSTDAVLQHLNIHTIIIIESAEADVKLALTSVILAYPGYNIDVSFVLVT